MKPDRPGKASGPASAGLSIATLAFVLACLPATAQDSTLAPPDPGPRNADSGPRSADQAVPSAPLEVVNLTAQGAFTAQAPRAGDSLDYVLTVEWPETGIPVMLLAPDSLSFEGFRVIGQATSHKKLAQAGQDGAVGLVNRTEFTWRLRAHVPGPGKATSARLRWLTGLSRNEEQRFIPAAHLDILPALVPLTQRLWFRLLAGWLLLAGAAGLAYAAYRFVLRRGKSSKSGPARMDLRPEALALKARIRSAGAAGASKDILTSMEALAIRHMLQELGPPQAGDPAGVKFDPLLDRYLARNAGPGGSAGAATDWNALRDLFRHARFAGGHKEPHELQDAYRVFRKCLQITDEPGED